MKAAEPTPSKPEMPKVEETFLVDISYLTNDGVVHQAPSKLITAEPLKVINAIAMEKEFGLDPNQVKIMNFTIEVVSKEVE